MLIVVGAMVAAALIAAAIRSDDRPSDEADDAQAVATESAAAPSTPTALSLAPPVGFIFPIAGACVPSIDRLLPGAARAYRQGIHEGVDFYGSDNCTTIGLDTEVLAARDGVVVRADRAYQDLTAEALTELMANVERDGGSSPEATDAFRGRQVWIDHGGGVVTRYAHLNAIAPGVAVGASVKAGELIAFVGESGTPASVSDPATQIHLHFEIRVGDEYLGEALEPAQARALYEQAWAVAP